MNGLLPLVPEVDSFDNYIALQETDLEQQFVLEFLLKLADVEETEPLNAESQLVWPGLVYTSISNLH